MRVVEAVRAFWFRLVAAWRTRRRPTTVRIAVRGWVQSSGYAEVGRSLPNESLVEAAIDAFERRGYRVNQRFPTEAFSWSGQAVPAVKLVLVRDDWPFLSMIQTHVGDLVLPDSLIELVGIGWWPTRGNENAQNLKPLVPRSVVEALAPGESVLFLYPPPFHTVRAELEGNPFWVDPVSRLDQLAPEKAIPIGDFGLGSDAPLMLDYSNGGPRIIRLAYEPTGTRWVEFARVFDDFVAALHAAGAVHDQGSTSRAEQA